MSDNGTSLSFEKEERHQEDGADTVYCPRFNNNPKDTHLPVESKPCLSDEARIPPNS